MHLHNYCCICSIGNPPSDESPVGPYPVVVNQSGGKIALVVQDYTFGKYLGYLNVTFDGNGDVTSWAGNPILLDASVQPGTLARRFIRLYYLIPYINVIYYLY